MIVEYLMASLEPVPLYDITCNRRDVPTRQILDVEEMKFCRQRTPFWLTSICRARASTPQFSHLGTWSCNDGVHLGSTFYCLGVQTSQASEILQSPWPCQFCQWLSSRDPMFGVQSQTDHSSQESPSRSISQKSGDDNESQSIFDFRG